MSPRGVFGGDAHRTYIRAASMDAFWGYPLGFSLATQSPTWWTGFCLSASPGLWRTSLPEHPPGSRFEGTG